MNVSLKPSHVQFQRAHGDGGEFWIVVSCGVKADRGGCIACISSCPVRATSVWVALSTCAIGAVDSFVTAPSSLLLEERPMRKERWRTPLRRWTSISSCQCGQSSLLEFDKCTKTDCVCRSECPHVHVECLQHALRDHKFRFQTGHNRERVYDFVEGTGISKRVLSVHAW